jgi:hypothetical protein
MDTDAILDAISEVKTALDGAELGLVYETIPSKPSYPSVIIAPSDPLIDGDDETFDGTRVYLDVWIISTPSVDNKTTQQTLYRNVAKAFSALEENENFVFDTVAQPVPVEYNQAKTLGTYISGYVTI